MTRSEVVLLSYWVQKPQAEHPLHNLEISSLPTASAFQTMSALAEDL